MFHSVTVDCIFSSEEMLGKLFTMCQLTQCPIMSSDPCPWAWYIQLQALGRQHCPSLLQLTSMTATCTLKKCLINGDNDRSDTLHTCDHLDTSQFSTSSHFSNTDVAVYNHGIRTTMYTSWQKQMLKWETLITINNSGTSLSAHWSYKWHYIYNHP